MGVHHKFDIEQEEYCFDVDFDDEGANLLINPTEQMIIEKLRSLLKFGPISTRYKDIFDIYYLSNYVQREKMIAYLKTYIFNDANMREKDIDSIVNRIRMTFNNKDYRKLLRTINLNWLDVEIDEMLNEIVSFLHSLK